MPFLIVFKISLSDVALSIPPYTPTLELSEGWAGFRAFLSQLDFENFVFLATDDLYWKAYSPACRSLSFQLVLTLLIGYPIAYGMANAPEEWRPTLMMLVILPFWTSFLIRVYSLDWHPQPTRGCLNQFLMWIGIINEPLTILNTNIAVYIGIVYTYLPFMILPIYAALIKLDSSLLEAAEDLGCSRTEAFWLITVPLSKAGIIAGCFLVFIPALGEFVIPSLLGGSDTLMIGKVLWEEFFANRDWPVASAVAVILLLILIIPIVLFQRNEQNRRRPTHETADMVQRHIPDAGLCVPLHPDARSSSSTASTKAAWSRSGPGFRPNGTASCCRTRPSSMRHGSRSRLAVFSSIIATILGTMAAYVLVRGGRFYGRTLFSGMIYAPLVMPEVITGLSLLLLFISIGLDRGMFTIMLAHTTFSMCYVSVVVSVASGQL